MGTELRQQERPPRFSRLGVTVRGQRTLPVIVLLIGLALTTSSAWFADSYLSGAENAQSARQTESATSAVRLVLDRVATAVRAVRAMYAADYVTRDQFIRFARTLTWSQTIGSLGFYRRVDDQSRGAYERQLKEEPGARLGIWELNGSGVPVRAAHRPVYYVIEAGYLANGDQPAYGLDATSLPGRAESIDKALHDFKLVSTGEVMLLWGQQKGVVMYDPVLDRNGSIVGVATASLTLDQLIQTAERVSGVGDISIAVGDPVPEDKLQSNDELASSDGDSRVFNLGERSWTVTVRRTLLETTFRHWVIALIVGLGLTSTVAILALIVSMYKTAEVTQARGRLRAMLDGLGPLAWLLSPGGTILNANRAATSALDRPESEMVGRPFWELLANEPGADVQSIRSAVQDAAAGKDVRFDFSLGAEDERHVFDLWIRCKQLTGNLVASAVDVTARYESEQAQLLLMRELDHRIKNTLQVIQAVIRRTARAQTTIDGFERSLLGRVGAMSRAHELLAEGRWQGANVSTLVRQETQSFEVGSNAIRASGPSLRLNPKAALSIALAIHELGTNASKYGALSSAQGVVDITWGVDRSGDEPVLLIRWAESGGPEVTEPEHQGFGSMLIERSIAYELEGNARIEYHKEGLVCTVAIPLRTVGPFAGDQPASRAAAAE